MTKIHIFITVYAVREQVMYTRYARLKYVLKIHRTSRHTNQFHATSLVSLNKRKVKENIIFQQFDS